MAIAIGILNKPQPVTATSGNETGSVQPRQLFHVQTARMNLAVRFATLCFGAGLEPQRRYTGRWNLQGRMKLNWALLLPLLWLLPAAAPAPAPSAGPSVDDVRELYP